MALLMALVARIPSTRAIISIQREIQKPPANSNSMADQPVDTSLRTSSFILVHSRARGVPLATLYQAMDERRLPWSVAAVQGVAACRHEGELSDARMQRPT